MAKYWANMECEIVVKLPAIAIELPTITCYSNCFMLLPAVQFIKNLNFAFRVSHFVCLMNKFCGLLIWPEDISFGGGDLIWE